MELTKSMKIGIGIGVVAIGGFVAYKVIGSAKTSTTPTTPAAPKAFDIDTFLNGAWNETYTGAVTGSDDITISGTDIIYQGAKTFNITSKKYDDATGTLNLSYTRLSNGDKTDAIFKVDKVKKVMTGTENDGSIQLVWTKYDEGVAKKYEGEIVGHGAGGKYLDGAIYLVINGQRYAYNQTQYEKVNSDSKANWLDTKILNSIPDSGKQLTDEQIKSSKYPYTR